MLTLATVLSHAAVQSAVLALQETAGAPAPSRAMGLVSPVLGYGLMAILGGAIIAVSLMPSKRGHQD